LEISENSKTIQFRDYLFDRAFFRRIARLQIAVGAARPERIRLVDQVAMLEAGGVESTLESDRAAVMLVARRAAIPSVNRKPVNGIER